MSGVYYLMAIYKTPILDGSNLIPTAKLGTGTPNASNYLRGDRTWAAPTAVLPDLVVSKNSTTVNQTILDGYSGIIAGVYSIGGTVVLTLQGTSVLKII